MEETITLKITKDDILSIDGLLIGIAVIGLIGIVLGNVMGTATIDGSNPSNDTQIDNSTSDISNTYQTGVTVCGIIVIIAVTLFSMKKLFSTGVLSKFDEEDQGGI